MSFVSKKQARMIQKYCDEILESLNGLTTLEILTVLEITKTVVLLREAHSIIENLPSK